MLKGNIIATVGISCSGKSTWAHKQWEENPNGAMVVERDAIRNLLFGYNDSNISSYYQRENMYKLEKEVSRYQDTLIYEGLEQGKTVILSNTHLDRKRDLESLKYWNVPVEVRVFPVVLKEALTRDMTRYRTVGEDVIKRQYNKFVDIIKSLVDDPIDFTPITLDNIVTKKKCILVDLDGTLCDMNGKRSPYEWKKVGGDLADYSVRKLVQNIDRNEISVIICTGRDGICLDETVQWLDDNRVYYKEIYIRQEGDSRADWVVKEEMWRQISKDYFILGLIDDRLQVCRRARALGLKVFNVEHHNF